MQNTLQSIAAEAPAQPLSPCEMVTDRMLRDLAHGGPERQTGEISEQDQAILAMILPDLCGELLAWRAAARLDPPVPFPNPRNHDEEIANAKAWLRLPPNERRRFEQRSEATPRPRGGASSIGE